MRPRFIGSDIYRRSSYGAGHPLAIPRVSTCIDLCRILGWLPDEVYQDSPMATPAELARFHRPDYIAAVQRAERLGRIERAAAERYSLGRNGNPVFPEIFSRPATACGASLWAARRLADPAAPERIIYSPAGGTHHGQPDRASGFCYFNDPVLAILTLLDSGLERVLYVDIDAHHCDGVQAALSHDPRVLMISIHEAGRWPTTAAGAGGAQDRGGGGAVNIPVLRGFNDSEMDYLREAAILPLAADFAPQVTILQCGADALAGDPLSRLELSNGALWQVAADLRDLSPRLLVLGGGGYNPWTVGRCWAGVWGRLNGFEIPERLPDAAEALLRGIVWRHRLARNPPEAWFTSLQDAPRRGLLREETRAALRTALARPAVRCAVR
ncbi:MAG TPA: acetoin utilization protein AcuC, partial [Kiloniellaceae bacterium]|nr:acetoin utilization protein AcuC [Kiloniellaceae bacterium]